MIKSSDTIGKLSQDVVLISGRLTMNHGVKEVEISVEPGAVNRKLAIRDLNGRLQGKTIRSNTYAEKN
ncbi:hypothetical protein [Bradyrhizobium sp.]|uniref:hypothetical protein n=1 Tax=Bradyrhizobium sp. TaxID=376 RepID=UPI0025C71A2F|nr:hypothetical protein [Bradyrhizobium sp.]